MNLEAFKRDDVIWCQLMTSQNTKFMVDKKSKSFVIDEVATVQNS